jgi:hypothetical protein
MSKFAAALVLSAMLLGGGAAHACSTPVINQAPGAPMGHCIPSPPAVMIHLTYLPKQIELHVGETVAFAADKPQPGPTAIDPSMVMNIPGSLTELNPAAYFQVTLRSRGDEERLWNVFEATKPGTFYASVVFTPAPGRAPLAIPVIINVLP